MSQQDKVFEQILFIDDVKKYPPKVKSPFLMGSQQAATKTIQDYFLGKQFQSQGDGSARIAGRFQPLLIGPSGSGKSHVIRQTAKSLRVPFFHVNLSDWIVRGAYSKPYTLDVIAGFVRDHESGIILLDEVDKLRADFVSTQGWWQSIATETFALLDGTTVLNSLGWDEQTIDGLKKHLIVGAGAWQEVLSENVRSVGFGEQNQPSLKERIEKSRQIPFEILARFSPNPIEITTPTRDDFICGFAAIFEDAGRSFPYQKLEELADRAVTQGRGARSLEHFATQMAIRDAKKLDRKTLLPTINSRSAPRKSSVQRAEENKIIVKKLAKTADRLAESAIVLAAELCRHGEHNQHINRHPDATFCESLELLAEDFLKLFRCDNLETRREIEPRITDYLEGTTWKIRQDREKYDQVLSEKSADFVFQAKLWQAGYNQFSAL